MALADLVFGEGFLVHKSLCLHLVEGARDLLGLFCKGANPILEGFTLRT